MTPENNMKRKWVWLFTAEAHGHRIWLDKASGRLSIADDSSNGGPPDRTDDGVLWIDTKRPIQLKEGHLCLMVTNDKAHEDESVVWISQSCATWLVLNAGMGLCMGGIPFVPVLSKTSYKLVSDKICAKLD